jgi:hypothetical protein
VSFGPPQDHACILNSVLGRSCVVGKWSRLEGLPNLSGDQGLTIFGNGVSVAGGVNLRSVIALPHKELNSSASDQIIL